MLKINGWSEEECSPAARSRHSTTTYLPVNAIKLSDVRCLICGCYAAWTPHSSPRDGLMASHTSSNGQPNLNLTALTSLSAPVFFTAALLGSRIYPCCWASI